MNPHIKTGSRPLDVLLSTTAVRGIQSMSLFHQSSEQKCLFPLEESYNIFGQSNFSHIIVGKHKPPFSSTKSLLYLFSLLLYSEGVCNHLSGSRWKQEAK